MLTPRELLKVEFKTVFRGYNEQQVDEFVKNVIAKYEELYRENQRLKAELEQERAKAEELKQNEDRVDELLRLARKAVEDAGEAARREADAVLHEARALAAAEAEKVQRQLRDSHVRLQEMKRREEGIRRRLKGLLHSFLDQIEAEEAEEPLYAVAGEEDEADDVLAGWAGEAAAAEGDVNGTKPDFEATVTRTP